MNKVVLTIIFLLSISSCVGAEEISFKNGDRISGEIVSESEKTVTLKTAAMGEVIIDKTYLKTVLAERTISTEETSVKIKRNLSLGYSQSGGNTTASQFSGEMFYDAKTDRDEWTAKVTGFYSSTKKKMDAKKFYSMLRYAYSFGRDLKWYHFYKLEADQDRFSNIDYRYVPTTGVGYWFSDKATFKALAEAGAGYEYTCFREPNGRTGNALMTARGFLEKKITDNFKISQNIIFYPSLEDIEAYRFSSESSLENKITDNTFWKLSFIDDYNSAVSNNIKKNDYRIITSLGINF